MTLVLIGCPETSIITTLRYLTSQNDEDKNSDFINKAHQSSARIYGIKIIFSKYFKPNEIAERIPKVNKAHYANAKLIKSKFLTKNTKMKIYKTMIRPVVTHSSETWTLTAKDEHNLRIFERQILRKTFGPVNTDNMWRIRNNMYIDTLIEDADIVRFIKAQRIEWLGHIQRMDQARPARKLLD